MLNKLLNLLKRELRFLLITGFLTAFAFILLALWRVFDSNTFTFHQIILICLVIGASIYFFTFFGKGGIARILSGKELAAILIIFTFLSFLILNVDRSRSVYLLKWVEMSSSSGISEEELSNRIGFSKIEKSDFKQRINEQISSGTIRLDQDKLKLTLSGTLLTKFFNFLAKFENLKGYPSSW
jgi:hypothetical protein